MPSRVAPRGIGWCPVRKHQSPEWTEIEAAKLQRRGASDAPVVSAPVAPAPAEYAAKQQAFLQAVEARRAVFDAMAPAQRDWEYEQLKRAFLGD